jgi:hypothetical protein
MPTEPLSDEQAKAVRDACAALVKKLDEVHDDLNYKAVWYLYNAHGGTYRGPTYYDELNRAREALKEPTP